MGVYIWDTHSDVKRSKNVYTDDVFQVLRAAFKQFATITKCGVEEKDVARAKSVQPPTLKKLSSVYT